MRPLRHDTAAFTVLLGALVTLASFATDMGLPVLDETAASLGVTPATAAYTLSVFILGFALGPLLFGPVSDRVGRRPVLLAGCAAFAGFGLVATFARSIEWLLTCRLLMGMGAGTVQVLVLSMVRDLYTGREARAKQSYVNLAGGVAPIIAPTLGVFVATAGGWRAIYAALAVGGVALLAAAALGLRETAPLAARRPLTVRGTLASYARVVRHPIAFGNAAVLALGFGYLFAYVSSSSLVLIGVLGASPRTYGAFFAATALGLMAGSLTNARLTRRGVPHARLLGTGLAIASTCAVTLLALTALGRLTPAALLALVVIGNVAHGTARPNASQGALEPMPEIVGVASAFMSALQMVVGASASAVAAALFDGRTALAMTGTMSVCSLGALVVYRTVVRPAERRRATEAPATEAPATEAPATEAPATEAPAATTPPAAPADAIAA
jgi:DHA1 family bicyclomycin/chloramphenicol resistance-like MFS transporter